jgi:hypothetical protein
VYTRLYCSSVVTYSSKYLRIEAEADKVDILVSIILYPSDEKIPLRDNSTGNYVLLFSQSPVLLLGLCSCLFRTFTVTEVMYNFRSSFL